MVHNFSISPQVLSNTKTKGELVALFTGDLPYILAEWDPVGGRYVMSVDPSAPFDTYRIVPSPASTGSASANPNRCIFGLLGMSHDGTTDPYIQLTKAGGYSYFSAPNNELLESVNAHWTVKASEIAEFAVDPNHPATADPMRGFLLRYKLPSANPDLTGYSYLSATLRESFVDGPKGVVTREILTAASVPSNNLNHFLNPSEADTSSLSTVQVRFPLVHQYLSRQCSY